MDQFSQDVAQIQDPLSGGGGGGGVVPVTGFASSDGFASVETPTPTTRDIKKGLNVGNLWDKDAAAAITDPPTLTVGGLPVGATYSQAEVTALRDALIALSDKVRDELPNCAQQAFRRRDSIQKAWGKRLATALDGLAVDAAATEIVCR
ncbi:MAG: hypothetical protein U0Y68_20755 [Blastocatellia bacterium]